MSTLTKGLHDEGKAEEAEEHHVEFIEAGDDAAESLEPTEESLDLLAAALERPLVCSRIKAGAAGRYDGDTSAI